MARLAIDEYLSGGVDDVFVAYTDFINTLTQRPTVLGWLPLIPHTTEDQVASEKRQTETLVRLETNVSGGIERVHNRIDALVKAVMAKDYEEKKGGFIQTGSVGADRYASMLKQVEYAKEHRDELSMNPDLMHFPARQLQNHFHPLHPGIKM